MVIWVKTDAGRAEMQARALVKERAQRNLLLVIDGRKTDDMLLAHLAGISPQDFVDLQSLGLIAPAAAAGGGGPNAAPETRSAAPASPHPAPSPRTGNAPIGASPVSSSAATEPVPLDYAQFTAALTQLIARELGLRGFMLTLAVEKASNPQELLTVAERAIDQIRDRRGEASAAAASRTLFGA